MLGIRIQIAKDEDDNVNCETDRHDLLRRDCQGEGVADEGQGQRPGQVVEVDVAGVPHQVDQCCLEVTK